MANWSTLYIGKIEALRWRNCIPEEDDPALCFLFRPTDKRVDEARNQPRRDSGPPVEESSGVLECWYQTNVAEARARFDRLGLTPPNLDTWISRGSGVPVENVELAVIDPSRYDAGLPVSGPLDGGRLDAIFSRGFTDPDFDEYSFDSDRIARAELGMLPELRNIRRLLDTTDPNEVVWIDLWDPVYPGDTVEDFAHFNLITLDYDGRVRIDRNYVDICKAHYSAREFDLVYIELVIALEAEIESYLTRKFEREGLPPTSALNYVKSMLKDLPLAGLVRFIFLVLEKQTGRSQLVDDVERVYNVRNNVVHQNQRTFEVAAIHEAMSTIEEAIGLLRSF